MEEYAFLIGNEVINIVEEHEKKFGYNPFRVFTVHSKTMRWSPQLVSYVTYSTIEPFKIGYFRIYCDRNAPLIVQIPKEEVKKIKKRRKELDKQVMKAYEW